MSDLGFSYRARGREQVVIRRHGAIVTTLRGRAAEEFLDAVQTADPQQVMARATGNYRRGNERKARNHPRNK